MYLLIKPYQKLKNKLYNYLMIMGVYRICNICSDSETSKIVSVTVDVRHMRLYTAPLQIRGIHPMLLQCWPSVEDGGPTLKRYLVNALCLLGHYIIIIL